MKLSVVLIAYDMQREVPRSLQSLAPNYQLDARSLDYEVIVVDNGSPQPLSLDSSDYSGMSLDLLRIDKASASPCAALNLAASRARGDILCIMIDGAHMLTPGAFQWALRAFSAFEQPVVATRYFYLGPGEQPETIQQGYDKAREDALLERIGWPGEGYRLFEVGTPLGLGSDRVTWFNRMFESNCLFLHRHLYESLGGVDERFDLPGGGFVNIDLYKRAVESEGSTLVQLVGEGSFHQLHGGTTTNSSDEPRRRRLDQFRSQYRQLRGHDQLVSDRPLNFMGHLPSQASKIHLRDRSQASK
ncbi:glycosyltransferase family A protein [Parahaliea aestuarii]|uniref:Glycosyltransferase family 2 protein n=1 Tax=Parahaliea aestuarii TaxID=1852021 RepID=A0A5C8ZQH7_9GAMM|nr:glycosyltransferase family A protein [Parahaliea aestuarii]TXS90054.1 glycosyltransferase family 2 protein [Parahaliea aestuarii]